MKSNIKIKFFKVLFGFICLFSLLFALKVMDLQKHQNSNHHVYYDSDFFDNVSDLTKNYSTERKDSKGVDYELEEAVPDAVINSVQKFEQTASVVSVSKQLDQDEEHQIQEQGIQCSDTI